MDRNRSRKQITVKEKLEILKFMEENKTIALKDAANKYGIAVSTMRILLRRKQYLLELVKKHHCTADKKRFKTTKYDRLNKELLQWFHHATANNVPVVESIFKEKAIEISDQMNISNFTASNGWFSRFKNRYKIMSDTPEKIPACESDGASHWKTEVLPNIVADHGPEDIYSADVFGLSSRALMGKKYVEEAGACRSSDQFSILLCSNSDGSDRIKPRVYGKNEALKNQELPYTYILNSSSWMSKEEFNKWIIEFNARVSAENRKVLLFLGNTMARSDFPIVAGVKIFVSPSYATSCLLPLYKTILKLTKQSFRDVSSSWLEDLCHQKISVTKAVMKDHILQIVTLFTNNWKRAESELFQKCFIKSGFCPASHEPPDLLTRRIEQKPCGPTPDQCVIEEECNGSDEDDELDTFPNIFDEETDTLALMKKKKNGNPMNISEEMSESMIAATELMEEFEEEIPFVSAEEALASIEKVKNFMAQTGDFKDRHWDNLAELENIIIHERAKQKRVDEENQ